jgi:hypothetical protein
MNPEPDQQQRIDTPLPRTAFTRTTEHYVWAILVYFVLSIVTKTFLTWTMATLYFVLALDVVPRLAGRIRKAASGGRR